MKPNSCNSLTNTDATFLCKASRIAIICSNKTYIQFLILCLVMAIADKKQNQVYSKSSES